MDGKRDGLQPSFGVSCPVPYRELPSLGKQALDRAASHLKPFPLQLTPDLACAVDVPVLVTENRIALQTFRKARRIGLTCLLFAVRRRDDRHSSAQIGSIP